MAANLSDLLHVASGAVISPPPAPKPTIKRLNFSHEAIARWLLENPDASLGKCAEEFGYTQGWLSIIIHSDAFRAKYESMQTEADRLVLNDIPAKMRGAASLALEGLADQVEKAVADGSVAHRGFLLDTSEKLLAKLGYGNKGGVTINAPNAQNVQANVVDNVALERARAKLLESRANGAKVVEGDVVDSPAAA